MGSVRALLALLFLLSFAEISHAAIGSTSGAIVISVPPLDVSSNQWESNTIIRAVAERQSFTLTAPLDVDITLPGTSPSDTSQNLSPGVIPAATVVNSYLIHFDVNGTRATNNALEAIGSITFTDEILGLAVLPDSLNASNPILGLPQLTYASGQNHAIELNPAGGGTSDFLTLSADRHTLYVDLLNASFADDARIITAIPEPASLALILLSLFISPRSSTRKQSPYRSSNTRTD